MIENFEIKTEKKTIKSVYCKKCGKAQVVPFQIDQNNLILVCKECLKNNAISVEKISVDEYKALAEQLKVEE